MLILTLFNRLQDHILDFLGKGLAEMAENEELEEASKISVRRVRFLLREGKFQMSSSSSEPLL
jgi:hypothetical protein